MKNNVGILREVFVNNETVLDLKGNPFKIISLDCLRNNYIRIQNLTSLEEKEITKQCFTNWYNNGTVKEDRRKAARTFRSFWKDDSKGKKSLPYSRWLKLKEKILIYTNIIDFNKDPFSYIEPDWLVFSKFEKWLLSVPKWQSLQIRGEVVLDKKIFDIDSVILAKYRKSKIEISSNKIEREEYKFIMSTKKWLTTVYQYDKDVIPSDDKIVYAISLKGVVLYVGSGNLTRPNNHLVGNSHVGRLNSLVELGCDLKYHIVYHSPEEVFVRKEETDLIKILKPVLNTAGVGYSYHSRTFDYLLAGLIA